MSVEVLDGIVVMPIMWWGSVEVSKLAGYDSHQDTAWLWIDYWLQPNASS